MTSVGLRRGPRCPASTFPWCCHTFPPMSSPKRTSRPQARCPSQRHRAMPKARVQKPSRCSGSCHPDSGRIINRLRDSNSRRSKPSASTTTAAAVARASCWLDVDRNRRRSCWTGFGSTSELSSETVAVFVIVWPASLFATEAAMSKVAVAFGPRAFR
jgi:hypothetical protein